MDSKKKLKLIPLHQFFKIMDTPSKVLYLVLYGMLVLAAVGLFVASLDPSRWVVEVDEFHATQLETVPLRSYTHQYRTMETEIGAWQEDVTYFASPMMPKAWILIAFTIMQVVGWAYLLTAASYIKNFVAYAAYFLYAMAIFLSGAFEVIAPGNSMLFNIGLGVIVFVPAFLFQQGMLRWKFALRLPLFTLVTALPFALVFFYRDWLGLHATSVSMFPILAVVPMLYLLFISKDLSQLIFFTGTNLPNPKMRFSFAVYMAVFLPVLALCFLMLHNAIGWHFLEGGADFPVKPLHVLAFLSLVMPGLNQNLSLTVKNNIDNRSFSVLITAFALVSLSALFVHVALGEYLFAYAFDRLFSILLFLTTLFHLFYMYYNFGPMLRAKMNMYFLSMMPKRLMFFFVLAATLFATIAIEASEGMKTQRVLKEVALNRNGDQELLEGRLAEAVALYNASAMVAEGSVKGNYNQAMLLMRLDGSLDQARECLRNASGFVPFAPAWINLGNLELSAGSPGQAKYYLNEGLDKIESAYLANNLAQAFVVLDEPDSAILAMKHALRLDPENPDLYSNLGRIYLQYGKIDAAKQFFSEGLLLPDPGAALVSNALFLNLKAGTEIKVGEELLQSTEVQASRSAQFNFAVERYKRRDYEGAATLIDTLLKVSETPDVLFLDGMLRFERGDVEGAISRMSYMDVNHPSYKAFTNHFLGVALFGVGVPEMASTFFAQSVANGRRDDLLNQARMEIDRGDHAYGYTLLAQARTADSTLMDEVAREEALLQVATGEYFFASLGFDLGSLTVDEWVRAGIYAGQKGNKPAALEAFRHAIEKDPSAVTPYYEMGKISMRLGDSLAIENLEAGLKKKPDHLGLLTEMARLHMLEGRISNAEASLKQLQQKAPEDFGVMVLAAEMKAAKGDTSGAIDQYKKLRQMQPLDESLVIGLARLMRAKRMDYDGQNLMAEVLAINPRNAEFWYEMAQFERLLDRTEEVSKAVQSAVILSTDPAWAKAVSAEFEPELKAFPPTQE